MAIRDSRSTGSNAATPTYPKANQNSFTEAKLSEKEHNYVSDDQDAAKEYGKQNVRRSSDPPGHKERYVSNNSNSRRTNGDQKRGMNNNKDSIYNSDHPSVKYQYHQDARKDSSASSSGLSASKIAPHTRVASVPKFGVWDETNPQSGEGYTATFERIKKEKVAAATKLSNIPVEKVCLTAKEIPHRHTSFMDKIRNCLFPRVRE
ncbi:uncharacterized protein [Typha angustifolia]|uniref:uncharacterized protein n=1 Tax=Typha angustifolia TaxID=59011 RepID=UPI003C304475